MNDRASNVFFTPRGGRRACPDRIEWLVAVTVTLLAVSDLPAWTNLLQDPGFEAYRLDSRGFYRPGADAKWMELSLGQGSVQFDVNDWKAPEAMARERPLGFTPGTSGYEGTGPEENSGRLIFEQDIVDLALFSEGAEWYEAWVWLGGAGRDDDNNEDRKDEAGGWEIFFYGGDDPAEWRSQKPLEHHHMHRDFWGRPGTFVQVAGFGRIPPGTKGLRMQVWATTWGPASVAGERGGFETEVALDNAHFAVIGASNLLINGDFELDDRVAEFKGWHRPAAWPFPRDGIPPLDINDVFGGNFDHGAYRPFYGGRRSYGYATYLNGWLSDAFTFGQYVDYVYPEGTPLVLMFNWIQAAASGGEAELRIIGSRVEVVVEYRGGECALGAQSFWLNWPTPTGAAAVGRYDQNSGRVYAPRLVLSPPAGTRQVGVHVNFMAHAPYQDGFRMINAAVDDFLLVPLDSPKNWNP